MGNKDTVDSGIIGYSELDDIDELKSELEELKQESDDLQEELDDTNREYEDLEFRYNALCMQYDPDSIKSNVIDDIVLHLNRDNMMTPELAEWIDNYCRFYLNNI